jgi:hypothetical protein
MVRQREEKREFMRVPFNTEVEIRSGRRTIRSTTGINVSLSGISMSTEEKAPPTGASCSIKIALGAPEYRVDISAQGSVVRSDPGRLAVQFAELDFDSYHHLRKLIVNNSDDPERAEREFSSHWGIRRPASLDDGK